jgi:hypothetical protein
LSHLASIRRQQQSWGRRALGLFVAVWLNLALQPCAMAYQVDDDHDCLKCPPMQMQEHAGMHGDMDDEMPCADSLDDCFVDEDLNHDGRSGQIKLKDLSSDIPLVIADYESLLHFQHPSDTASAPRYASLHSGAPPPLHILYCVYLD